MFLEGNIEPFLGGLQARLEFIQGRQVLLHFLAVTAPQFLVQSLGVLIDRIHQLHAQLELRALSLEGAPVSLEEPFENLARVVLCRDGVSLPVVRDRGSARGVARPGIDGENE